MPRALWIVGVMLGLVVSPARRVKAEGVSDAETGHVWLHLESDWKKAPPEVGIDESWAYATLLLISPKHEFACIGGIVRRRGDRVDISPAEGHRVFLGSWSGSEADFLARFRLMYETVEPMGGGTYPGPEIEERIIRRGDRIEFQGKVFESASVPRADAQEIIDLVRLGGGSVVALVGADVRLDSSDPTVRRQAAMHLGAIGSAAAASIPSLLGILHGPSVEEGDEDVRAAAWALGQMGERGVGALIEELRSRHEMVLEPVVDGLVEGGKAAVPALIAALGEGNDYLRDAAAQALGGMGPVAGESVPALIEAAQHRSAQDMPIWALGKIGPVTKEVVPFLAHQLDDAEETRRLGACSALGEIGASAVEAVPRLAGLLGDTSATVRAAAAGTLGRIGPAANDAVPALESTLSDPSRHVRSEAAGALKKIRVPGDRH
jgi:HEAT repeat protein